MTFIDPSQKDKIETLENGKRIILLPNGKTMIDATRFAWERDSVVVHPTLKLTLQYKMLEDIFTLMNEKLKNEENIRTI